MPTLSELSVKINADLTEFEKEIKKLDTPLNKFATNVGKKFQSAGAALTKGLTLPIAAAGAAMVKLASDAEVVNRKFNTAFKGVTKEADAFADSLKDGYGIALTEGKKLLANTGDLLKGFGATASQALDTSVEVQKLAAALSAYNGVPVAEASQKITSALLGETEGMKSLGVAIKQADVEQRLMEKGQSELTGQSLLLAKAQATLELAMGQSSDALASFGENQNTVAFQTSALIGDIKDLCAEFGKELLPYVRDAVKDLRELAAKFSGMSESSKKMVIALAGTAAAMGPILIGFGKLVQLAPALSKGFGMAQVAAKTLVSPQALGALVSGGPIIVGIAAVGLAVGGMIYAINKATKETKNFKAVVEGTSPVSYDEIAQATATYQKRLDDAYQARQDAKNALAGYARDARMSIEELIAIGSDEVKMLQERIRLADIAIGKAQEEGQAILARYNAKKAEEEAARKAAEAAEREAEEKARIRAEAEAAWQDEQARERARIKLREDLQAELRNLDALAKAGAITEQELYEEKIALRKQMIDTIKEEGRTGVLSATAAAAAIKTQQDAIDNYQEALDGIISKNQEVVESNVEVAASVEKIEEATEKAQDSILGLSAYFDQLGSEAVQAANTIDSALNTIDWSSPEKTIGNIVDSLATLGMQSGTVVGQVGGAILSIGKSIYDAIDGFVTAQKKAAENLAKVEKDIALQKLANQKKILDQELSAKLGVIEKEKAAALAAAGFAEDVNKDSLDEQLEDAYMAGDMEKVAKIQREKEKAEIVAKYEKQAEDARKAAAIMTAKIEQEQARIQKEIAIAQVAIDRQKAISDLGWFASKKKKAEVNALYDSLLASISSVPLPSIPAFARGTDYAPGGMALVGEEGPELVNIPRGSSVIPAQRTMEGTHSGSGVTVNIYSPVAVTPSESNAMIKQTMRELAFVGVI